jgi:hypothetical protein
MTTIHARLHIGEDNLVRLLGLKDAAEGGDYINNATVTTELKEQDGTLRTGSPVTMTYAAGTNGIYEGVLEDTLLSSTDEGSYFWIEVTAKQGANTIAFWRLRARAEYRR